MNNDYSKEQLSKFNENTPLKELQKYMYLSFKHVQC